MEDKDATFQNQHKQLETLFSIGHSNQSIQAFLKLLELHNIQVLIDIRSSPYSKYVPHFNSSSLSAEIKQNGIQYLFMGKELGGRPDGDEFYDAENHVLYNRVAESSLFLTGIKRLKELGKSSKVAIMCSEENPISCHRRLLVGRVLAEQGVNLLHIRGNGQIQTEKEIAAHEEKPLQQSLFEQPSNQEQNTWRSIRPVSRKKPQQNSLNL